MHRLVSAHIVNFRSCKDVELQLGACTPIVGYNNAGKSNLLHALAWFLRPSALGSTDFFERDQPVVVSAQIGGLTNDLLDKLHEGHRNRIRPLVDGGVLWLRRVQEHPSASKKDVRLEVFKHAEEAGNGDWGAIPTGIDAALGALFPEPIFVAAMEDAEEDATHSKAATTFGGLLSLIADDLTSSHGADFDSALAPLRAILSPDGEHRSQHLEDFDAQATAALAPFFPGVRLHVDFALPSLKDVLKSGTVRVHEDERGQVTAFSELGHGAQRSIQMALIRYLADRRAAANDSLQCRLLLIEEPELFLHPQAVELVRLALERLSTEGYQIVFATHSPLMVGRKMLPDAAIVRKPSNETGTHVTRSLRDALAKRVRDNDNRLHTMTELKHASGWLFSDRVLLVEGKTEAAVLPAVFDAISGPGEEGRRLAFSDMGGKTSAVPLMAVFNELGIEAKALLDIDFAFDEALRHGLVDPTDEHFEEAQALFRDLATADSRVRLGRNDIPISEKGDKAALKAKDAILEWLKNPKAQLIAQAFHEQLKPHGIWLWTRGAIEDHLGLDGRKNPTEWARLCDRLEREEPEAVLADHATVTELVEWLSSESEAPPVVRVAMP